MSQVVNVVGRPDDLVQQCSPGSGLDILAQIADGGAAPDSDTSGVRADIAGDNFEQGGLASTVLADNSDTVPHTDVEAHIAEKVSGIIGLGHIIDTEHRFFPLVIIQGFPSEDESGRKKWYNLYRTWEETNRAGTQLMKHLKMSLRAKRGNPDDQPDIEIEIAA